MIVYSKSLSFGLAHIHVRAENDAGGLSVTLDGGGRMEPQEAMALALEILTAVIKVAGSTPKENGRENEDDQRGERPWR